jgi:hypothetical protein
MSSPVWAGPKPNIRRYVPKADLTFDPELRSFAQDARYQEEWPQDDVLAVERAITLANRHGRLARVVPHGSEAICLGIEARNFGAGAPRSIRIEEGKI